MGINLQPSRLEDVVKTNAERTLIDGIKYDDIKNRLPDNVKGYFAENYSDDDRVRVWGNTHDTAFKHSKPGDLVVFTGFNKVWAYGRIRVKFHSSQFANATWDPGDRGNFEYVYEITDFRDIRDLPEVPKSDFFAAIGKPSEPGLGSRYVPGEQAMADAELFLGVDSRNGVDQAAFDKLLETDNDSASASSVRTEIESRNISETSYEAKSREVKVRYLEKRLVEEYVKAVKAKDPNASAYGLRIKGSGPSTRADLIVESGGDRFLIEAKASAHRNDVRMAIAQLLEYSFNAAEHFDRLIALLPGLPSDDHVKLLDAYGIEIHVFDISSGGFTEHPPVSGNYPWKSVRNSD